MRHVMGWHGVSGIQIRPAREPAAWTAKQRIASAQSGGLAGSPTEVQLQLVRYDGLPGLTLQLQGIEHVLEARSAPRRPLRAPRRPLNDAAAYADLVLAEAASAPFHPQRSRTARKPVQQTP